MLGYRYSVMQPYPYGVCHMPYYRLCYIHIIAYIIMYASTKNDGRQNVHVSALLFI